MAFLDDVRQIKKPRYFVTGPRSQVRKLNAGVSAVRQIIEAAERNADSDNSNGVPPNTFDATVIDNGVARRFHFVGKPV